MDGLKKKKDIEFESCNIFFYTMESWCLVQESRNEATLLSGCMAADRWQQGHQTVAGVIGLSFSILCADTSLRWCRCCPVVGYQWCFGPFTNHAGLSCFRLGCFLWILCKSWPESRSLIFCRKKGLFCVFWSRCVPGVLSSSIHTAL